MGGPRGLSLLDVGCAKGHLTEAFRRLGFEAHGLDYADVAVERAGRDFPDCSFRHMDGFNPEYAERFDVVVCRGFSGANTHDLDFVAAFSNKYVELLNPGGFYVFAFNTDWSGAPRPGATACWSRDELAAFAARLHAEHVATAILPGGLKGLLLKLWSRLRGRTHRDYFYAVFRKEGA
jgi:2-polyprenyl-3-methyl-5-hydroxy-6-metoxy-1,4-benzoquinol methylase